MFKTGGRLDDFSIYEIIVHLYEREGFWIVCLQILVPYLIWNCGWKVLGWFGLRRWALAKLRTTEWGREVLTLARRLKLEIPDQNVAEDDDGDQNDQVPDGHAGLNPAMGAVALNMGLAVPGAAGGNAPPPEQYEMQDLGQGGAAPN